MQYRDFEITEEGAFSAKRVINGQMVTVVAETLYDVCNGVDEVLDGESSDWVRIKDS